MTRFLSWLYRRKSTGFGNTFAKWKLNKWMPIGKPEDEQAEYDRHLQAMFAGPDGEFVLSRWLADVYCTVSYVPGGRCCDTSYNDGQRAFIHEILVALNRIENRPNTEVETDAELSEG